MIHLFDHTERNWARRRIKENGAGTYSKDIVAYQLKNWDAESGGKFWCLSTCNKFNKIFKLRRVRNVNLYVQYLHQYPYSNPIAYICRIYSVCRGRVLFLTAYKSFYHLIKLSGMKAKFVPMAIDVDKVSAHRLGRNVIEDRIIYFGNKYNDKHEIISELENVASSLGYKIDYISDGYFNETERLTQEQAWERISKYKYGIGVGRCALEMWVLGVKVMIAGNQFGGIVIDESDWAVQEKTNFNGRCITFDRDIATCMKCISESMDCSKLVRNIKLENHAIPSED